MLRIPKLLYRCNRVCYSQFAVDKDLPNNVRCSWEISFRAVQFEKLFYSYVVDVRGKINGCLCVVGIQRMYCIIVNCIIFKKLSIVHPMTYSNDFQTIHKTLV